MATPSAVPVRSRQLRLRHVLFASLVLMFLFVLWHDERFIFVHSDEKWTYFFPVRWLVFTHALAGLTALVIGPFQLSTRFRERHLGVHRVMGRVYLSCVAIAAVMGIYVSSIHQKELQDRLWVLALAVTWLVTGAMAFAAVRNGNIDVHRQWITRNYAFTSVFVTVRVLIACPSRMLTGSLSAGFCFSPPCCLPTLGFPGATSLPTADPSRLRRLARERDEASSPFRRIPAGADEMPQPF